MMRRPGVSALIAVAGLLSVGCGTRVERQEEAGRGSTGAVSESQDAEAAASPSLAPLDTATTAEVPAGSRSVSPAQTPTTASGSASTPAKAGAGQPTSGAKAGSGGDSQPASQRQNAAASNAPSAPAPVPGQAPSAPAPTGPRSPVKLGNIGVYSGPAGSTTQPALQGAQLWVKHINAKGGLNGHPVELIVYDDGGDPARNKAAAADAIERQKVLAFLNNNAAIAGAATTEYINSKRIPVIGGLGEDPGFYTLPMFFPQQTSGDYLLESGLAAAAQQSVPAGKTKLGFIFCTEAPACPHTNKIFTAKAKAYGMDYVYQGQASIAQPDYTAECLAARNAGVQVLWVLLDSNSVPRVANSCARQGFRPQYASGFSVVHSRWKDEPNLDNVTASSNVFPWFQTGTGPADEFQRAYKAYGAGLIPGLGLPTGWTSGKLLERAAANLPEPPTTEAILKGLWSLKDDSLGGITQPLTFVEGKPAAPKMCWFNVVVKKGAWVTPDGYQLHCK